MKTNIKAIINDISSRLQPLYHDINQSVNIACLILQFVTGYTKAQLVVKSQINLLPDQEKKLNDILYLHTVKLKPIQYILKSIPFLNLEICLKEGVLIPRPETEYWCSELIQKIKSINGFELNILDLCTGTGCIGLSFAKEFPESTVYGVDISEKACNLAKQNAECNNIKNFVVMKSDLYSKIPYELKFDLIISNPPYISYKNWKKLDPMVKNWEAKEALTAKRSGTFLIKKIIKNSLSWLKKNNNFIKNNVPQIVIEMDENQGHMITKLLKHYGFDNVVIKKDLANRDRTIEASVKKWRLI